MRRGGNRLAQTGRNAELCAGIHGVFDLVGGEQRAGADGNLRNAVADAPHRFRRAGGAERDLHRFQSAGQERLRQRHGVFRLVQHRDAQESLLEKKFRRHGSVC